MKDDKKEKTKKEKKPLFESSAEVQKEIERLLFELEEKEDELTVEAETLYAWIKAQAAAVYKATNADKDQDE